MPSLLGSIRWLCACMVLTSLAHGQSAGIENRVLARRLADEGANLYESGNYEDARELFHRANELYPAPALECWEARSLKMLGRLVEAEERYASVKRYRVRPEDSDVVRAAVDEASIEVESLRKKIPTLIIRLQGASAKNPSIRVQVAGKVVAPAMIGLPIPIDPSTQVVTLIMANREVRHETVVLSEGDNKTVTLQVDEASVNPSFDASSRSGLATHESQPRSVNRVPWYARQEAAWAGIAAGSAGLAVGIASGLMAISKHSDLTRDCPHGECPEDRSDDIRAFHTYRTISTIGYAAGILGIGLGVTMLVVAPGQPTSQNNSSLLLTMAPGATSIRLQF